MQPIPHPTQPGRHTVTPAPTSSNATRQQFSHDLFYVDAVGPQRTETRGKDRIHAQRQRRRHAWRRVQLIAIHAPETGAEGGRAILEASAVGEVEVEWRSDKRAVPEGWSRVDTDQPLGAIAVYSCEPESDDGAVENGLAPVPAVGDEHPAWRVR